MPLAATSSPGGLGFLIFVIFIVAAVLIFLAMTRSMRRMRSHVDRGDFGTPKDGAPHGTGPGPDGAGPAAPPERPGGR